MASVMRPRRLLLAVIVVSVLTCAVFMTLFSSLRNPSMVDERGEWLQQIKEMLAYSSSSSTPEPSPTTMTTTTTTSTTEKPEPEKPPVRILCWLMTDPADLNKRVIHVKNTWARHCDVTLYFSSAADEKFPTIGLNVSSGRDNIAVKSRESWKYVGRHHLSDADYFLKADPDTYVIVHNMREYLSHCDPSKPEAFGHRLNLDNLTYFSGATFVLSREAVRRLVFQAYVKYSYIISKGQGEDWKNSMCLQRVGTKMVDTKDLYYRETFMPLPIKTHLYPTETLMPKWYRTYRKNDVVSGRGCCSQYPVSFHYVNPEEMYMIEYLLQVGSFPFRVASFVRGKNQPDDPPGKVLMFMGTKKALDASNSTSGTPSSSPVGGA